MTTVVVGRIGRPHGVRGAVTVQPASDDPAARFTPGATLDTEPASAGPLTVVHARASSGVLVVTFAGIDDRTAAEALRGATLTVDSVGLPELDDPDEFYDHQLIGLAVVDAAGEALGVVTGVVHPPAAPVLEVGRPDGREELVPFVRAIVPEVDLEAGRVVVHPPDGMFA